MDAFRSFLQKYDAVPTTKTGTPQWNRVADRILINWAESDLKEWTRSEDNHPRIIDRLADLGNELRRRIVRDSRTGENFEARFMTAHRIFSAIGFGLMTELS